MGVGRRGRCKFGERENGFKNIDGGRPTFRLDNPVREVLPLRLLEKDRGERRGFDEQFRLSGRRDGCSQSFSPHNSSKNALSAFSPVFGRARIPAWMSARS